MELRKIASKKPTKLLTLLLTSLLIATASAAVYYSLYMQTGATLSEAVVKFVQGGDWSNVAGSMGQNGTWCVLSIKAYPNATLTYEEPINLTNTDSASSHQVKLTHSSISPDNNPQVGNWSFINFTFVPANGTAVAEFDYTVSGNDWVEPSMNYQTILASETWAIKVETKAAEGAQADLTVTLVIYVDVQE